MNPVQSITSEINSRIEVAIGRSESLCREIRGIREALSEEVTAVRSSFIEYLASEGYDLTNIVDDTIEEEVIDI